MSSKSEFKPNANRTWSTNHKLMATIAVITIAAFFLWVFYLHPAPVN